MVDGSDGLRSGAAVDDIAHAARLAVRHLPTAVGATITAGLEDRTTTLVASGLLARQLDGAQLRAGDGPCLSAVSTGCRMRIDSMVEDQRWPEFAGEAVRLGVRSSLSLPLTLPTGERAAFNVYCSDTDSYDRERVEAVCLALVCGISMLDPAGTASQRDESPPEQIGRLVSVASGAGHAREALELLQPGDLVDLSREAGEGLRRTLVALEHAAEMAPPEVWDALHDEDDGDVAAWADDASRLPLVLGRGEVPLPERTGTSDPSRRPEDAGQTRASVQLFGWATPSAAADGAPHDDLIHDNRDA